MKRKKLFSQTVVVEFNNCSPYVDTLKSKNEITMEAAVEYYESKHSADWDRDSITFVDNYQVSID